MRHIKRWTLPFLLVAGLLLAPGASVMGQHEDPPSIRVGSLGFTESVILAEMMSLLLEDAGYTVERKLDLGVSAEAHEALVSGEIDMYVEYTGGGLVAILGLPVPTAGEDGSGTPTASVADQTYTAVAEAYLEEFGLVWLEELGFNNTYALAVTVETAEAMHVRTISDLTAHAGDLSLGTDLEFPDRQDGLLGLEQVYGMEFGEVVPGDPGLMYEAIADGEVDVIAAYTTDGRLPGLDLVLLEDDLAFFPPYRAAPVVDLELLEANPEIEGIVNQLSGTIDENEMAGLNYLVDVEGQEPADVARAFLEDLGLIDPAAGASTQAAS